MAAIEAENLTKHYRVYLRPVDRLKEALTRRPRYQLVEALRDVSLRISHGGTLGIIGENGAGKSTLLKILAGTVHPTAGNLSRKGRVAALLELGSGFHPEFSGRGNIHLNAALLGLSEKEIKEREQSIIEFAELEEAIERPVKTYSSGMYLRLAFSIATSVDPDVLIIDEALSVGDQRFQQKCVERMIGFRQAGKTIVVCSHSMYLINELCSRTLWLANGRVCKDGKTSRVISSYLASLEERHDKVDDALDVVNPASSARPDVVIKDLLLLNDEGRRIEYIEQFQPVVFRIRTRRIGPPVEGHLAVGLERPDGQLVFGATTKNSGLKPVVFSGDQIVELLIPSMQILRGSYRATAVVSDSHTLRVIDRVKHGPYLIESDRPELGFLWMKHRWRFPDHPHE